MTDPRQAAARCLAEVVQGGSLSRLLPEAEARVNPEQRPLLKELCYGTLRQYWRLHAALAPLFKKPLKNKDTDIRMLVYLGAYQLFHTRVPSHAVINTTVEACRSMGKPWAAGLINAMLRRCQRDGQALFAELPAAAQAALPPWLYQIISQAWPEQLAQIVDATGGYPPMCLRVNRQRQTRDAYRQRLMDSDIDAQPCQFADQGLRLASPCGVEKLPGFFAGEVSVQDEAAQLCTQLLQLAPGQRVLDACAAPGGKSGAILEAEPQLRQLVALDVDAKRLQRVEDNLNRLSLSATLISADATATAPWWDGETFDRILLDAPCSATGVLRRNPDILLHRSAADIAALSQLQLNMLDALWQTLKPGGILVYATCSIVPTENSDTIARFLSQQADAEVVPITGDWGQPQAYGRQILPARDGADGFYYATLRRRQT